MLTTFETIFLGDTFEDFTFLRCHSSELIDLFGHFIFYFTCFLGSSLFGNKEAWYPNYIDEVKSDAVKLGLKPDDPCVKREVKSDNNEPDD